MHGWAGYSFAVVYNPEFILTGILRQQLEYGQYPSHSHIYTLTRTHPSLILEQKSTISVKSAVKSLLQCSSTLYINAHMSETLIYDTKKTMYRITDLCILCRHICFYIGFLLTVQIVFDLQEHLLYVCVVEG